ncbi:hypothetical protein HN873_011950 [Arachis hypogaea]
MSSGSVISIRTIPVSASTSVVASPSTSFMPSVSVIPVYTVFVSATSTSAVAYRRYLPWPLHVPSLACAVALHFCHSSQSTELILGIDELHLSGFSFLFLYDYFFFVLKHYCIIVTI